MEHGLQKYRIAEVGRGGRLHAHILIPFFFSFAMRVNVTRCLVNHL